MKNLTDATTQCIYKFLSGRIVIPLTKEKKVINKLLISKPSWRDRILGFSRVNRTGIRSLTECSLQTIRKYIRMPKEEITKNSDDRHGREHKNAIQKIMGRVEEVRTLQKKGYSIKKIAGKTSYTKKTIKNYLFPDFNPIHGQYGV